MFGTFVYPCMVKRLHWINIFQFKVFVALEIMITMMPSKIKRYSKEKKKKMMRKKKKKKKKMKKKKKKKKMMMKKKKMKKKS